MAWPPQVSVQLLSPDGRAVVEALGALAARVASLEQVVRAGQTPVSHKGRSAGDRLTVALDLRGVGAVTLEVMVRSSVAATFYMEGSVDGVDWTVKDTLTLAAPGERHEGYINAYPVVRVRTEDIGDHEIELVAAR